MGHSQLGCSNLNYTLNMTKQQGLGEYGKQRFKESMALLKNINFEKDKKLWTILGYLPKDEQKQIK